MRYVIDLERDSDGRPVGRVVSDVIEHGGDFKGWFELLALLGDVDSIPGAGAAGAMSSPETEEPSNS